MGIRQRLLRDRHCQNLAPSLDEVVRNEVIAPLWLGLHAFSADNAPKSCINLVPNDLVQAFYEVIEAFYEVFEAPNEVAEAFWCDNLVPSLVEVVRNEVIEARHGGLQGKNRGFAPCWFKNVLNSHADRPNPS